MFFKRQDTSRWIDHAVRDKVDETRGDYDLDEPGEMDLHRLTLDLFDSDAPDFRSLRESGVDAEAFYRDEVAPCWEGLGSGERRAKMMQFARVANATAGDELADTEIAATIRAKTILLAWGYDHAYGRGYTARLCSEVRVAVAA